MGRIGWLAGAALVLAAGTAAAGSPGDWFGHKEAEGQNFGQEFGPRDWNKPNRQRWNPVLGAFKFPCWIDHDDQVELRNAPPDFDSTSRELVIGTIHSGGRGRISAIGIQSTCELSSTRPIMARILSSPRYQRSTRVATQWMKKAHRAPATPSET